MKICPKCSYSSDSNEKIYCPRCGEKLLETEKKPSRWFNNFSLFFAIAFSILAMGLAIGDIIADLGLIETYVGENSIFYAFAISELVFTFLTFLCSFILLIVSTIAFINKKLYSIHKIFLISLFLIIFVSSSFLGNTNASGTTLSLFMDIYLIIFLIYEIIEHDNKGYSIAFALFAFFAITFLQCFGLSFTYKDNIFFKIGILGYLMADSLSCAVTLPFYILIFICAVSTWILFLNRKLFVSSILYYMISLLSFFIVVLGVTIAKDDAFYGFIAMFIYGLFSGTFGLLMTLKKINKQSS